MVKEPKTAFKNYLRQKGIRRSKQRDQILNVFLNVKGHVTSDEIYSLVRKRYPRVGYATVYRAMKVISEAGIADGINFGDGATRYEPMYRHKHHDHLVCLKCGKFLEVVSPQIERLQEQMAKRHGFVMTSHRLLMYGTCKECRRSAGE